MKYYEDLSKQFSNYYIFGQKNFDTLKIIEDLDHIRKYVIGWQIIREKKMIWFDYVIRCQSCEEYNKTLLNYYDNDEETVKSFYLNEYQFNLFKRLLEDE